MGKKSKARKFLFKVKVLLLKKVETKILFQAFQLKIKILAVPKKMILLINI